MAFVACAEQYSEDTSMHEVAAPDLITTMTTVILPLALAPLFGRPSLAAAYPRRGTAVSAATRPVTGTAPLSSTTPISPNVTAQIDSGIQAASHFITHLLTLLALLAGLVALVWIIYRAVRRPRQLVVDTIVNATGDDDLGKTLPGLSVLARQYLAEELTRAQQEVATSKVRPKDCRLVRSPLPASTVDNTIGNLLTSLSAAAPADLKPLVQLAGVFFPPRGARVSGTLQRCGDAPGRLGLTFDIALLDGRERAAPYTVWEPEPAAPPRLSDNAQARPAHSTLTALVIPTAPAAKDPPHEPDRALSERAIAILHPGSRWLALKIVQRALENDYLALPNASVPLLETPAKRAERAERHKEYKASIYNFLGAMKLDSAGPAYPYFYTEANTTTLGGQDESRRRRRIRLRWER